MKGMIRYLKQQMDEQAGKWEFEKAQELKVKLELLEKYQSRSSVVNPAIDNVDVFSVQTDVKKAGM